jgi:hypothetical protein
VSKKLIIEIAETSVSPYGKRNKKIFKNCHFSFLPHAHLCRTNVSNNCFSPDLTPCIQRSYGIYAKFLTLIFTLKISRLKKRQIAYKWLIIKKKFQNHGLSRITTDFDDSNF